MGISVEIKGPPPQIFWASLFFNQGISGFLAGSKSFYQKKDLG
jgi:hypothetical protein